MYRGYIPLYRKSVDNPLYFAEPFTRWQAWQDLILYTNWQPKDEIIKGRLYKIKRGQIAWSMVTMAQRWKWHRDKVKRFLIQLQNLEQIQHQTDNITTLITIINYDIYTPDTTADTTANPTSDTTTDTTAGTTQLRSKEVIKKDKKEESPRVVLMKDKKDRALVWIIQDQKDKLINKYGIDDTDLMIRHFREQYLTVTTWNKNKYKGPDGNYQAMWNYHQRGWYPWQKDPKLKEKLLYKRIQQREAQVVKAKKEEVQDIERISLDEIAELKREAGLK